MIKDINVGDRMLSVVTLMLPNRSQQNMRQTDPFFVSCANLVLTKPSKSSECSDDFWEGSAVSLILRTGKQDLRTKQHKIPKGWRG